MPSPSPLPSFRRPPVGEVVLALQFEQLAKFDLRHVGPLVQRFGDKYPTFETQQPLPPTVERFDGPTRYARGFVFEMAETPSFPRVWLVDAKGEELVQIQRDRLMHNWRTTPNGAEYPRYPRLRGEFAADWAVMDGFVREERLGSLLPTQCEVAYINHIEVDGQVHDDPSKYFSFFASPACLESQAEFEAVTYSSTGVATEPTEKGAMTGRLFVEVTSGFNTTTKEPVYQFSLSVRGAPLAQDLGSVLQFFDFARARIVKAFAELTTPEMHRKWGMQQ